MTLLRPLITGIALTITATAWTCEIILTLTGLANISDTLYWSTAAATLYAGMAHLLACNRKAIVKDVTNTVDTRLDARLDIFEVNNLHTVITSRNATAPISVPIAVNGNHPTAQCPGKILRLHPKP